VGRVRICRVCDVSGVAVDPSGAIGAAELVFDQFALGLGRDFVDVGFGPVCGVQHGERSPTQNLRLLFVGGVGLGGLGRDPVSLGHCLFRVLYEGDAGRQLSRDDRGSVFEHRQAGANHPGFPAPHTIASETKRSVTPLMAFSSQKPHKKVVRNLDLRLC
jgi:hypothetical protein